MSISDSGMNGDLSNDTQDSCSSHETTDLADLRPDDDSVDSDKALNLVSRHLQQEDQVLLSLSHR